MTPCSVRITNGTDVPPTVVDATSTGIDDGSARGFTRPSVARYDQVVCVGDVAVGVGRGAEAGGLPSCTATARGAAPRTSGRSSSGWSRRASRIVSPDFAVTTLAPSRKPVTSPRRARPTAVNAALTSLPFAVTTAPAAPLPEIVTSTSPPLTSRARVDVVSSVSSRPGAETARVAHRYRPASRPLSRSRSSRCRRRTTNCTPRRPAATRREGTRDARRVTDRREPWRSP